MIICERMTSGGLNSLYLTMLILFSCSAAVADLNGFPSDTFYYPWTRTPVYFSKLVFPEEKIYQVNSVIVPSPLADCVQKSNECFSRFFQVHSEKGNSAKVPALEPGELSLLDSRARKQQRDDEQKTVITTFGKPSRATLIFIHGLYENSTFSTLMSSRANWIQRARFMGFNTISLSLPGHGAYSVISPTTIFEDWTLALNQAIDTAKILGDKIILVGHSTGGLLALQSGSVRGDELDGLILIEPALKVRKFIRLLSCGFQNAIPDALNIWGLKKRLDVKGGHQPIQLSMGCEVAVHGDQMRQSGNPFSKIQIPTLVVNNPQDNILDANAVKTSIDLAKNSNLKYIELDENYSGRHGKAMADPPKASKSTAVALDTYVQWILEKLPTLEKDAKAEFVRRANAFDVFGSTSNKHVRKNLLKRPAQFFQLLQSYYGFYEEEESGGTQVFPPALLDRDEFLSMLKEAIEELYIAQDRYGNAIRYFNWDIDLCEKANIRKDCLLLEAYIQRLQKLFLNTQIWSSLHLYVPLYKSGDHERAEKSLRELYHSMTEVDDLQALADMAELLLETPMSTHFKSYKKDSLREKD